ETPPRCPALVVRGGRRVALPAPGHQHPQQERPVPGGPPPPPRPGRRLHSHRQADRPGPSPLQRDRDQPGLVPGRRHRLRSAVLATPTRPGRSPRPGRTQDPALSDPAHRRAHRPRPTQTQDPHPRNLALGPRTRRLLAHRARPAPTDPMLINPVPDPDPGHHPEPWNPAPTRGDNRAPNLTAP